MKVGVVLVDLLTLGNLSYRLNVSSNANKL